MVAFNNKYYEENLIEDIDNQHKFWKELGVKSGFIKDMNSNQLNDFLKKKFLSYNKYEISEVLEVITGEEQDELDKREYLNKIINLEESEKRVLSHIFEFINRKKKVISNYLTENVLNNEYESSISKLFCLFKENPSKYFAINVLYNWRNKSTQNLYNSSDELYSRIQNIVTESSYENGLIDKLYNSSGQSNRYKIHSFSKSRDEYIFMVYKQLDDVSQDDFSEAVRNRIIDKIMFSIKKEDSLLEIKSGKKFEQEALVSYLENTFDVEINEIERETFEDFNIETFKEAILKGKPATDKIIDDFVVDKIKFKESLLTNSPSLIIELKGVNLWDSLNDADNKSLIDFDNLGNIENISIRTSKTRKTIYTAILENGDVFFRMNNSKLDAEVEKEISENFYEYFGIPLLKPISTKGTRLGETALTDYILRKRDRQNLFENEKYKEKELFEDNVLVKEHKKIIFCTDKECGFETESEESLNEGDVCPNCENQLNERTTEIPEINLQNIEKYIENRVKELKTIENFGIFHVSEIKVFDKKYKFLKIKNLEDQNIYQILIVNESLSNKVLKKMRNLLNPILIITVGQSEKSNDRYIRGCIEAITFGEIYECDNEELHKLLMSKFNILRNKTKDSISDAATDSSKQIQDKSSNPSKNNYSPSDFEDDVYVLLKDFFMNADKWGNSDTGKPIPEGIFTLMFEDSKGKNKYLKKMVYSYDCKLNKNNNGYNINAAEKDKAIRYIENLSDSSQLKQFSDSSHLDGHIFISNKFKGNHNNVYTDLRSKLQNNYDTEIIFLTSDALVHLHYLYRKNYNQVENNKDIFMYLILKLFNETREKLIEEKNISQLFDYGSTIVNREIIDFEQIKSEMTTETIFY